MAGLQPASGIEERQGGQLGVNMPLPSLPTSILRRTSDLNKQYLPKVTREGAAGVQLSAKAGGGSCWGMISGTC